MFLQSSIKENAVCTRVCCSLLHCFALGLVLHPPSASVHIPTHSHGTSQCQHRFPGPCSLLASSPAATHGVFGAVCSPVQEVMGVLVAHDGRLDGQGASRVLWGGARRAPTAAVSLEEALIPFVFQGAANSRWSQVLLVRQEEPWGDDLNVYVYRNV